MMHQKRKRRNTSESEGEEGEGEVERKEYGTTGQSSYKKQKSKEDIESERIEKVKYDNDIITKENKAIMDGFGKHNNPQPTTLLLGLIYFFFFFIFFFFFLFFYCFFS